jgi:superfamily II DNA or RNA helicase
MNTYHNLIQSLHTGFVNRNLESKQEFRPYLILNDHRAGKKVLGTILKELKNCDEFWFSVAFITTSGVATIVETLKELSDANIKGKILTSQYLNFTQPEALRRLKQFNNIELRIATEGNFHSKGYLFKKGDLFDLIIGSSNLTASALSSNKEWNLKVTATEHSDLITQTAHEFALDFKQARVVDDAFIDHYEKQYQQLVEHNKRLREKMYDIEYREIKPNLMQREALSNIRYLREAGKKKALLISATGTGKTYLSAFDVREFKPRKLLFVVHRRNIAEASMKTYEALYRGKITTGLYSGSEQDMYADFIFSTVQTLSKDEHLKRFAKNHFDYIVIDETHRAGAASYQKILDHFEPDFLLGMTATPERTDGLDVFKLFDYNIAYEIRLHKAMEEDMLSPFHYYGVSDLSIDGNLVDDAADFNLLTADERVNRIIDKATFYGCDDGNVRGLIFCSRKDECHALSKLFNERGYKTIALTGEDQEEARSKAILCLESDDPAVKIDYIFTVDIFNEGIDIPRVNQIIMLRPTQSAIIFVQQLGRGLRKVDGKEYLTVIDFIGNYQRNYLVPVALYGDNSYNKDTLRKLMSTGSQSIPGSSTINFDKITKERIYEAIDRAKLDRFKDMKNDYQLLKFKLGHIPSMCDFVDHGSRDPFTFIDAKKSYFNFVKSVERDLVITMDEETCRLLEFLSTEVNNTKRVEESHLLSLLITESSVKKEDFRAFIFDRYGYSPSDETIASCVNNVNLGFVTQNFEGTLERISDIFGFENLVYDGNRIELHESFVDRLKNDQFRAYLLDNVDCAIKMYDAGFVNDHFFDGFQLYRKYSRKDVFRILNWDKNPLAQNVGGYIISPGKENCPVFVNYHKHDNISATTNYDDVFLNRQEFQWMSKSKRNLKSPDVVAIRNSHNNSNDLFGSNEATGMRIPLFIKKSNDEGTDFYFMGDVKPIDDSFEETHLKDDKGKKVSVVKLVFKLDRAVDDNIYEYITDSV